MPIYFDLVCALVLWSGTGPLFAQEQKSEDDSTAILIRARNLRERLNDLQDEFKFMGDQVTKISVFDDLPPREKEKLLFMLPPTLADADTSHLDPMTEIKKNPHLNGPLIEMILNNVKALPNLRVGMTAKEVKKIMSVRFEFIGPPDKQRLAPNPCRKEKFIRVGHEYLFITI